uniref:Uncharacterized protein n=1 Tax=Cacopsylla melanoneura TaxID=428564 RepID=A0A8D8Z5V2_9HEMI
MSNHHLHHPSRRLRNQHKLKMKRKKNSPPGGLEPPTFRLTAERANQLRHGGMWQRGSELYNFNNILQKLHSLSLKCDNAVIKREVGRVDNTGGEGRAGLA